MFAVLAIVSFLMLSPAFGFGEQFTDLVQSIPGYINDFMGWANGVYVFAIPMCSRTTRCKPI